MVLRKGSRRLFDWLRQQTAGTVVTYDEVMAVAGWSESSLRTYIHKNKIAPFLLNLNDRTMQVRLAGEDISERYFDEVFTQQAPRDLTLAPGDDLTGNEEVYVLEQPIGSGAIGQVWVAKRSDNTRVAAKVMLPRPDLVHQARLPDVRQRFRAESMNGQVLSSDYVIAYLDLGQVGGHPFLIMELADRSVRDRLATDSSLAEEEAAEIAFCAAEGLRYLHGRGLVHRDIKPDNILALGDLYKLGDLGVVRWTDFDHAATHAGIITRQSVRLGSWHYIAPEQSDHPHDATPASDVYSLGVTWIELLTGDVPSPQAVGAAAYELPGLREGIAEMIRVMCAFRASDRPALDDVRERLLSTYNLQDDDG
ncbi:MAG: serine/threonine-protein kinase [Gammaproteobacteria bacterium]|nr:serine/threonine-protein kinase [Gammaproteobacteria bacterium]